METVYTKKENLDVLDKCIESNIPVLLVGETGTGKTTLVKKFAKDKKKELVRVSLNGNISTEEILGKYLLEKERTVWQDGILTEAIKKGHWVVFDEINSCSPEILFAIHALLDEEKALVLSEKNNERIEAHKDFRFIASMNPDDYAGTKTLNQAFISRFIVLNIEPMIENDEIEFLKNKHKIAEYKAKSIVSIGSKLRKMKQEQQIDYFCSTRDLEMVADLLKNISLEEAFKVSVFNKMTVIEKEEVLEVDKTFIKFIENNSRTLDAKIEQLKQVVKEVKDYEIKKNDLERIKKDIDLQTTMLNENRLKVDVEKKKINEIVNKKVEEKIKSLLK